MDKFNKDLIFKSNVKIFDAHAHYDDDEFDSDRDELIGELKKNNVIGVLNCGCSLKGSEDSVKLAQKYDFFYAAVGIHPEYADKFDKNQEDILRRLASYDKVRAVGEIGLDYYYDENPDRDIQKKVFIRQMKLAEKLGLPVIIHDRDAHEDTLNIVKSFPNVKGEIHCFSGSVESAREYLKLGYYLGFTGVVTFKNAKKTIQVLKEVPIDRILVETDCPYMTPAPYRGKRNMSAYIYYIMDKIAEVKEIPIEEVSLNTILNIRNLLNLR
ncbi:TatD family hydrolase [Clostridium sp. JN-1]|jgi:TatD DNase family protein|uniref:TatD family hydrolase n=1 Tax=Clostridium sp. JN-1 TaxID=2483110 RepID=UPI000F0B1683|nr:TatD family hydrolase [Clostridium sp. JN-1]